MSFYPLLEVEACLIEIGLLLALQTDLSSALTISTLVEVYSGGKKQKIVILNVFFISTKWLQKLPGIDNLQNSLPSIPSFNGSQRPTRASPLTKNTFFEKPFQG